MNINKLFTIILIISGAFITKLNAQESHEIESVLAKRIEYNSNNNKGKGFKIQLYNGNESKAYNIKGNFESKFNMTAVLSYDSPEWKVQVGNYRTKLDADRALLEIKESFVGAIVLETKINL